MRQKQSDIGLVETARNYQTLDNRQKLEFFVSCASQAPSGHNLQPWRFKLGSDYIELYGELQRKLHFADLEGREFHISLGACLENICLAAEALGVDYRAQLFGQAGTAPVAKIEFPSLDSQPKRIDEQKINAIYGRHNNRFAYDQTPIESSFFDYVRDHAPEGIRVDIIADAERRAELGSVILDSVTAAFHNRGFSRELSRWTKPSLPWYREGLPGYNLGVPYVVSFFVPLVLRVFDMSWMQRRIHIPLLETVPAYIVLSTADNDPRSWIKCGRFLERFWVEAEQHSIRLAVLAASIETGDDYKKIQKILDTDWRPQVCVRLGHTAKKPNKCPRLDISQLIIN